MMATAPRAPRLLPKLRRPRDDSWHAAAKEPGTWSDLFRSDQADRGGGGVVEVGKQLLMTALAHDIFRRNYVANIALSFPRLFAAPFLGYAR